MAKVADRLPDVDVRVMNAEGRPETVRTAQLLGSGTVVLFAVPGAFTPGCSRTHLPGYIANADGLAEGKVLMLADDNGDFSEAMGLVMDFAGSGLGKHSRRYAAVLEDGVIMSLDMEETGGVTVSACEAVLAKL